MQSLRNLKIKTRLYLGFATIGLFGIIAGFIGIMNVRAIGREDIVLYENMTVPLAQLSQLSVSYQRSRIHVHDLLLAATNGEVDLQIQNIAQRDQEIERIITDYKKLIQTDHMQSLFTEFSQTYSHYLPDRAKVVELIIQKRTDEAKNYLQHEGMQSALSVQRVIDAIVQAKVIEAKNQSEKNIASAHNTAMFLIIAIILVIFLSLFMATVIARGIIAPITPLALAARKLAVGDIEVTIGQQTNDEIGLLMSAFAEMVESTKAQAGLIAQLSTGDFTIDSPARSDRDVMGSSIAVLVAKLHTVLAEIHSTTGQLAAGAGQIADSSEAVSHGVTEQACTVKDLSDLVTQITQKSNQTAILAKEANNYALTAQADAQHGNLRMQEMLGAMQEMNSAATNIAKIIKVIDEIAFQTNILALNAAIEAARAGQHGKGFAVVAEEVRNLAARSAKAAGEISNMIGGSLQKTEDGKRIADQTADSLKKIVEGAHKVSKLIGNIAMTSEEQATGFTRITQGIAEVSQVVSNNAATAQQSAAASEEMAAQAMYLKEILAQFTLRKEVIQGATINLAGDHATHHHFAAERDAA